MIPEQHIQSSSSNSEKEQIGSFSFFNIEHFLKNILRNWYWFLFFGLMGYLAAYIYNKYYAQSIYASSATISISSNSSSYFTPNQSINFIWGQSSNQEGMFLKKLLTSRSHNEFLASKLDLFVNYKTRGRLKNTYLDKDDSPVYLVIDKNHLQATEMDINLIPKPGGKFEVRLPEEFSANNLYDYRSEDFKRAGEYKRAANRVIAIGEWYETPYLKFKLVKNKKPLELELDNVVVTLKTIDQTVNEIKNTLSIEFDEELSTIMIITKKDYNLNSSVNFLNKSIEELKEKRIKDKSVVDKNTVEFIKENLDKAKIKLDSSSSNLNTVKISERISDEKENGEGISQKIINLEQKRAELITKINALNSIKRSVANNIENLININAAGVEDGSFNASVSELKALFVKRAEMAHIYTPQSEPMREINRLISEARGNSYKHLDRYYDIYNSELSALNRTMAQQESDLRTLPLKQQKYIDAQRGYTINETIYNTLLSKLSEAELRLKTNTSDINVIDKAKNLGQGPVSPNKSLITNAMTGIALLIPLFFLLLSELLDTKIRSIKEVQNATKIPLLGVIGKNKHINNLSVLEHPKSSIAESFRGVRANLRFLYNEDGKSKVVLITSSVGGEGKTFASINVASVLGLSGKKTILLGMDLRKPKIFGDFNISNKLGISNFLTGEVKLEEIINNTSIPGLDIATSGPIPPNPSELLMSEKNKHFLEELKEIYDFIIIDSPPVGLVADSFELMKYSDANVYVVRHEYTEKFMLKMIAEKYHDSEVKHLGFIYNDFLTDKGYGYGYGYFDEDVNYEEPTIIKIRNAIMKLVNKK